MDDRFVRFQQLLALKKVHRRKLKIINDNWRYVPITYSYNAHIRKSNLLMDTKGRISYESKQPNVAEGKKAYQLILERCTSI